MTRFGENFCSSCGEKQWSIADNKYLKLFGTCWKEDKGRWERGELSLEEFERRELEASL